MEFGPVIVLSIHLHLCFGKWSNIAGSHLFSANFFDCYGAHQCCMYVVNRSQRRVGILQLLAPLKWYYTVLEMTNDFISECQCDLVTGTSKKVRIPTCWTNTTRTCTVTEQVQRCKPAAEGS